MRAQSAVGVKCIAAYRVGLDLDPAGRPTPDVEVAGQRLATRSSADGGRSAWPTRSLHRFLVWAAVDLGLPLQFHVGYGDATSTSAAATRCC